MSYLERRGWSVIDGKWLGPHDAAEGCTLSRALHHQLTADLSAALGWKILDYSPRGYVTLEDPVDHSACTLPSALRRQARREGQPVKELTYTLFLSKLDEPVSKSNP